MGVLDSEEADEDDSIDNDSAALGEEVGRGLVGASVTEEVKYMQKVLEYSSLSFYKLKPSRLFTHLFENNRTAEEKLFKHVCNFGER